MQSLKKFLTTKSSVDPSEMLRFSRVAQEWWNPAGPYALLHRMNPLRVSYIRSSLESFNPKASSALPFNGLRIADIGCGGGFLSHNLARLGAQVTAVDANVDTVNVARAYKNSKAPDLDIEFMNSTAESLERNGRLFDALCALEILEHVSDPQQFLHSCTKLVKPGGLLFLSTINRTPASYIGTILLAEKILGWVPNGTHSYQKYITPKEMEYFCIQTGSKVLDTTGMTYNPITRSWSLAAGKGYADLAMNYIMSVQRNKE